MRALSLLAAMLTGCLGSGPGGGGGGGAGGGGGSGGGGGGGSFTAEQRHNLETVNRYRSQAGRKPLVLDEALSAFALDASEALAASGMAHGHFAAAGKDGSLWRSGFCTGAAENQGPGWPTKDVPATIDAMMKSMMDEGPGGGHHDNILDARWTRLGVGLLVDQGRLYLTNDFSADCR
jgi:uncharacterized protein YkwD